MQLHIREIPKQISLSVASRTNLLLIGPPGIGKSRQVEAAVKVLRKRIEGFGFWPFDVPSMSPPDVGTYMPNMETKMLEYFRNGLLPNAYDMPDIVGIVFMDEVLAGDNATTKLLRKYINGEDINGVLRKPDGVIVVAGSNSISDRAGSMQQDRAFMRRWEQVLIYGDAEGNIEFAMKEEFHPTVQSFFKKWPEHIDNYERVYAPAGKDDRKAEEKLVATEESKRGLWANMGGWERISKLEYASELTGIELVPQRFIGNVGSAVGLQYNTYRNMVGKLATVQEIVKDPKGTPVPENMGELYAQLVMLAMRVDIKDIKSVDIYLARTPGDMKAMCINRMLNRTKKHRDTFNLTVTKEYQKWMADPAFTDLLMAR